MSTSQHSLGYLSLMRRTFKAHRATKGHIPSSKVVLPIAILIIAIAGYLLVIGPLYGFVTVELNRRYGWQPTVAFPLLPAIVLTIAYHIAAIWLVWLALDRIYRRSGLLPMCVECGYPLEKREANEIRCPECGTPNNAAKWLISSFDPD